MMSPLVLSPGHLAQVLSALAALLRSSTLLPSASAATPLCVWFALVRKCVLDAAQQEAGQGHNGLGLGREEPGLSLVRDAEPASVGALINSRCVSAFLAIDRRGLARWRPEAGVTALELAELLVRASSRFVALGRGRPGCRLLAVEPALLSLQVDLQHEARLARSGASLEDAPVRAPRLRGRRARLLTRARSVPARAAGGAP